MIFSKLVQSGNFWNLFVEIIYIVGILCKIDLNILIIDVHRTNSSQKFLLSFLLNFY